MPRIFFRGFHHFSEKRFFMFTAILSLVLVGASWTLAGVVMGAAPKKKLDPAVVQLTGAVISFTAALVLLSFTDVGNTPFRDLFWCGLAYWGAGAINCIMLILMSNAMQKGPNGIIWAVIQSAMIFPFMMGILFFNVEPRLIRFAGLFSILISLLLSGVCKKNNFQNSGWKLPTFIAFLLTGVTQNLVSLPSYFEASQAVTPVFRTMCLALGILFMSIVRIAMIWKKISLKENLTSKWLWIFTLSLQFFGLLFAIKLQYPSMDTLAKLGAGSLSYPLLVGSCVVGFSLYSLLFLKEKVTPLQWGSLASCLAGIILICL
jgi:multidrug transporter EmrE-like cation transporter